MADVAGLLASAIVTQVGAKLGSVIGDQVSMLCCFEDDMEDMKATLESMEAALEDAEKRSIKEKEVRLWLKRLKNAALDISDMIDECHTDSKQTDGKMAGIFSCLDIASKITVANKMKKMRDQLRKIKEDHLNFKFEPYPRIDNDHLFTDRETTSMINKADIVGRDKQRQGVIALLSASNNKEGAAILPIFGLGGIGKTTLAQLVFSDIHFKDYDYRVWVYVSQVLDMKRVGNTIISQVLKEGRHDGDNMEFINRRIQELLDDRKTLIILDDLWETDDSQLNKLKLMLNVSSNMKVLVTTRNEDIAKRICTIPPFRLSPLNNDMCWDIIKKHTHFESREDKQQLEQIGQAIASKCGGVPLAAQALGFMLSRMDLKQWNEVSNSDIWNEPFAENSVLPSLKLSYIAMPPNLRLCFAYCAIFPRGHSISKDNLIHQWIALDFIKPSNMFSNLLLGDKYFGQLLGMSFLQHSKLPMTAQRSSVFTMHDLVYDLARSVMDEELIVYNADKVRSLVDSKYRLYASLTDCSKPLRISTILPAKLRALLFQNCSNLGITGGSFSFAKCLRVLDLTESSISSFPSSVGQLKHLRFLVAQGMKNPSFPNCIAGLSKLEYLNIHGSSQVSPRPESLGKLEHLMYLDLSGCSEIVELPERSLENLKDLVHLELSTCSGLLRISEALCYLTKLQYLNLSGCSNLKRLPQDLGNLTKLQYLYLSGCHKIYTLPKSIGKLINLVHLDLSRCSFVVPKALGGLTKLKYLSLSGVLKDDRKAKETIDNISTLANLEHLDLSWNPFEYLPKSIGDLKRLHTLDLSGCRELYSLPDSIGSIDSLELLVVDECSEMLKEQIRRSGLKCSPLIHLVVRRNKHGSGSNLHQLEDKNPSELEISGLEELRIPGEARAIQLHNKENLLRLKLEWTFHWARSGLEDKDVLGELAPPSGLKHLVLIGYGSIMFPNWLMMNISHHLPNLVSVQLRKLPRCTSLPPLGQLPNLKDLYLEDLERLTKISGDDLCAGKRAFPQLSRLTLYHMRFLEWSTTYRDEDGRVEFMFPALHELVIEDCPRLRLKPCPPLFHRWQITDSDEVLNFREECDRSAAPRTSLVVSTASYRGSWSLLSHLSILEELEMKFLWVDSLPESMRELVSLRLLVLFYCENIMLPEWLGDLKSLQSLRIERCQTIKSMPSSIQQLTKLQRLHITNNTELQKWCHSERNGKLAHIKDITYSEW